LLKAHQELDCKSGKKNQLKTFRPSIP